MYKIDFANEINIILIKQKHQIVLFKCSPRRRSDSGALEPSNYHALVQNSLAILNIGTEGDSKDKRNNTIW